MASGLSRNSRSKRLSSLKNFPCRLHSGSFAPLKGLGSSKVLMTWTRLDADGRMVVIDATMLLLLVQPGTPGPKDATGAPVTRCKERIELLIATLDKEGQRIAIPTPAL